MRDAHSGATASYGEPITLSLRERLTGVNAAGATYGLDHQLIALVWIVGFSAYFTDEAMARAGEALHAETRAISKALGGD